MKSKNKKFLLKNWLLLIGVFFFVFIGIFMIWISSLKLPDFSLFKERKIQNSTKIYDRTGEILLYDVYQDIKRTTISSGEIGQNIKNATIAIEDGEFYNHKGIRISSIIRATIWAKITGSRVQGGSTITQQLIKNTLLTSNRSISRKIKEWILAIKAEKIMTKDEILTLYLNEAPYGGTIYGIKEASNTFFNKEPTDLTIAESAYLAAIPNGPTKFSPYGKNKNELDDRKNLVLKRMLDVGFINENQYNLAKNEKVTFQPEKKDNILAPHFIFFIKNDLEKKYGSNILEDGGLKVITTIDYDLQKKAEEIVFKNAKENEINWGGKNAAAVIIDPKTGQILAMVGSRDYFDKEIDGNYNVVTAKRQPGSSFKPIVYALAFEKGYTDETVLFDVKTEFNASCSPTATQEKTSNGNDCYHPNNYDNSFRGPMSLREALAQSINIIAVKLLYLVGSKDTINFANKLGITTLNDPNRYGLSLVIGGGETTLLDMTSVYSVFANNGTRNPYNGILSIQNKNGEIIEEFKDKSYQVLDKNISLLLSDILSDNKSRTPTFGTNSPLVIPDNQVAVKTGTTNDNKDAWTIGYTPKVTVGVWVGNNDNTPMKKGGASLAGPIWNQIITESINKIGKESFEKPYIEENKSKISILRGFWMGGETIKIDSISKKLATEFTPKESIEEISITNVHTILHWINKENPLSYKDNIGNTDSLYNNWEYGILNWWNQNKYKYKIITEQDIPNDYDNIHTKESKPEIEILGFDKNIYTKEEEINYLINLKSEIGINKIDIYLNSIYLNSIKNPNNSISSYIKLNNTNNGKNIFKVIAIDNIGNRSEKDIEFIIN
jgi:1A family penicillin-binding protein